MHEKDNKKADNVVSLFAARSTVATLAADDSTSKETAEPAESFEEVMVRNSRNKERLEKERATANKSVLRTYKIKT